MSRNRELEVKDLENVFTSGYVIDIPMNGESLGAVAEYRERKAEQYHVVKKNGTVEFINRSYSVVGFGWLALIMPWICFILAYLIDNVAISGLFTFLAVLFPLDMLTRKSILTMYDDMEHAKKMMDGKKPVRERIYAMTHRDYTTHKDILRAVGGHYMSTLYFYTTDGLDDRWYPMQSYVAYMVNMTRKAVSTSGADSAHVAALKGTYTGAVNDYQQRVFDDASREDCVDAVRGYRRIAGDIHQAFADVNISDITGSLNSAYRADMS